MQESKHLRYVLHKKLPFIEVLFLRQVAFKRGNTCANTLTHIMLSFLFCHSQSLTHTQKYTDLPLVQVFWAQANEFLAPPAGQDCPCHRFAVPWSTGQILHTYSDMRCPNLAGQSQTVHLLHQTPEPACKLQDRDKRESKSREDENKMHVSNVFRLNSSSSLKEKPFYSFMMKIFSILQIEVSLQN